MSSSNNFKLYAQYYDLLNADKNYEAEAFYVAEILSTLGDNVKTVLEFGSGTGKHGLHLNRMGYDVLGVERSEKMVQMALKSGLSCVHADISEYRSATIYDAVISLFHVISYQTDNDSLIATFKNANRHLKRGGLFLFDVWYSPAVYTSKAENRIRRMQNNEIDVIRFAEPRVKTDKNIIDVHFSILVRQKSGHLIDELNEVHPMRHFSIPEVELISRMTGFQMICAEAFLTREVPSEDTWGVCFVLKKK